MELISVVQWLGALGVAAFYPIQNWRLFLTRNPAGISFLAFAYIVVGNAGYLVLALRLGLSGLAVGTATNLFFATLILAVVWFRSSTTSARERNSGIYVLLCGFGLLMFFNMVSTPMFSQTVSGFIGLIGILMFYPIQNAMLFRTKDPTGLSLIAFVILAIGLGFYTLLGILVYDAAILLGNGAAFLGTLPIIYIIVRYRTTG